MAFNWIKDQEGFAGTGKCEEYFIYNTDFSIADQLPNITDEERSMFRELEERDRHLCRLMLEWAVMCGCSKDDQITAAEAPFEDQNTPKTKEGWCIMVMQPDDPIYTIYFNGEPKGAYYASFRGMYQAGCYIHSNGHFYYAHNFREETPMNQWIEGESTCGDIARDFLLGNDE